MTAWPTTEGLTEDPTAVEVEAALTVWVMLGEVGQADSWCLRGT